MKIIRNIIVILGFLLILLLYTPIIQKCASPLIIDDKIEKADVIVVFSEGWQENGVLSEDTMENYRYGIKLFQQGLAPKIIFSGGSLRDELSPADEMADIATNEGFPHKAVISENCGETTYDRVILTKRILMDEEMESIILVTQPHRAKRTKQIFEDKNTTVISAPVTGGNFEQANGLERIKLAKSIIIEYGKLMTYKIFNF